MSEQQAEGFWKFNDEKTVAASAKTGIQVARVQRQPPVRPAGHKIMPPKMRG